jgi:pimeloyl-ACP methyl ester carboxylesterase
MSNYDDYAGDTTTNGRMTTFSPVYGVINWVGDQDWFRIYLSNTTTYLFDQFQTPVTATNNLDSFLRLVDASGNQVPWAYDDDSGGNRNAEFSYTPIKSDYYYLSAEANSYSFFGTLTGSYGLYASEINHAPVVTGVNQVKVASGQTIMAASMFNASDIEGNNSILTYEFYYDTVRVGHLSWSDSALVTWNQTNRTLIVPATALNTITYTGDVSGTETLQFAAYDGALWSNWGSTNITVSQINHTPVLDASYSPILRSISTQTTNQIGNTVAEIVNNESITDIDTAYAPSAILIESVNNNLGTWQFSTNSGSTWQNITGLTAGHGLALDSTAWVRLLPNGTTSGTTSFTFGAWDQSDGAASGTYINYTAGLSNVSLMSDTASITVNSPAVQPTKTASEIFNNEGGGIETAGMIRVLADFSKAAYSLQPWEDTSINDYMPNADTAKEYVLSKGWVPLELDIPSLSATSMVGSRVVLNGMSNGFYTNENAAAFVARSTDAVVISFRGTNDNAKQYSPTQNPYDSSNTIHPDVDQWGTPTDISTMADHFTLFQELITQLDLYLLNSSSGIKKVYITGHSLGGAMALEYMANHLYNAKYQAVTFAAPAFTTSIDRTGVLFFNDSRITQIEISEDPVPATALATNRAGHQILFFGDQTANEVDWHLPLGKFNDDNHSMDYYRQITKSIDPPTWQTLIDQKSDLKVLIGATSGPFLDVTPTRTSDQNGLPGDQYDTYFIVDGSASGYLKSPTATVAEFQPDTAATKALAPVLASGIPVYDGVNVPISAWESNYLSVGAGNYDVIYGGKGDDVIVGGNRAELIVGGAGIDTAIYSGNIANYTLTKTGSSYTIHDKAGADGTDTLTNVERLSFSDMTVALDINGNAGQSYRLYQAAFNRTPDNGGLKYWIGIMDSGTSLQDVSSAFLLSNEFKTLYGANPTTGEFVNRLYSNVLHRAPDQGGYDYWVGLLDNHQITARDSLINFSESDENQLALIGVIQNGIDLYP